MNPSAYIETSVISYLTARPSRDVVGAAYQKVTGEWWRSPPTGSSSTDASLGPLVSRFREVLPSGSKYQVHELHRQGGAVAIIEGHGPVATSTTSFMHGYRGIKRPAGCSGP